MNKVSIFLLLSAIVLAVGALFFVQPTEDKRVPNPDFRRERLTIERSDGKKIMFNVEIAETPEQHAHGLMFRSSLPDGAGMLFLFDPPQNAVFWMKNTRIPLDMLFVRTDGSVVKIAARTAPNDLTRINSGEPVAAVLEINGGATEMLGIKVGDKVKRDSGFEARTRNP